MHATRTRDENISNSRLRNCKWIHPHHDQTPSLTSETDQSLTRLCLPSNFLLLETERLSSARLQVTPPCLWLSPVKFVPVAKKAPSRWLSTKQAFKEIPPSNREKSVGWARFQRKKLPSGFSCKIALAFLNGGLKETLSDTFHRTMENRSSYTCRYRARLCPRDEERGAFCDWTRRATTKEKGEENTERKRKISVPLSSSFYCVVRPRKRGYHLISLIVLPRIRTFTRTVSLVIHRWVCVQQCAKLFKRETYFQLKTTEKQHSFCLIVNEE